MDKLSNYMTDFDNINLPIEMDEIEYIFPTPYHVDKIQDEIQLQHNYIYRQRESSSFIDLPSNVTVKKIVTTDTTIGFVSHEHEFFILYDNIQYFEKIANHIKDCLVNDGTFILITEDDKILFVNASNGDIRDDMFWLSDCASVIYTVKGKIIIKTKSNSLYIYDSCVNVGFSISEIDELVRDVIVTFDTITVLTLDGRVWVFGNEEHGAYITNGRGFISCISNAKQVVRTVRAGAVLTECGKIWAWGDVKYGGSPVPGFIKGLKGGYKNLLNNGLSIIAITENNQLWAWSNIWFKTYDLMYSDFAVASCIDKKLVTSNIMSILPNKISWLINTKCGLTYYIGNSIKIYNDFIHYKVNTNGNTHSLCF